MNWIPIAGSSRLVGRGLRLAPFNGNEACTRARDGLLRLSLDHRLAWLGELYDQPSVAGEQAGAL
jgi:hypothetical protein